MIRPFAALLALLLTAAAPAASLPGLGAHDPRAVVDLAQAPWSALLRLQVPGVSRCTAVQIDRHLVLTAAHCLYSRRLGHFVPAAAVHLLSRYAGGNFVAHGVAAAIRIADGYDPAHPVETRFADAALITLSEPIGADSLLLAPDDPPPGTAAMLGGYSQDRAEVVLADRSCHVLAVTATEVRHDCTATRGVSGAPLLVPGGGGWRIAGIVFGAEVGQAGGAAVRLKTLQALLAAP